MLLHSEPATSVVPTLVQYHSTIKSKGLEKTLGLFRRGVYKYLVCIEAVGIGLISPILKALSRVGAPNNVMSMKACSTYNSRGINRIILSEM